MYNCNLKKNYIGFNSKGKAIIMKKLGRKGSACMMAIALCAMTVPVFAGSNNKSVKSAKYNAYATEYVGFVEGPLTISDKVSYTFTLSGKQNNKLSIRRAIPCSRKRRRRHSWICCLSTSPVARLFKRVNGMEYLPTRSTRC